tara:strand:- start:1033 stop:1287 length:255 start_codon:yes stop_codon:yes gene_type:complete
MVNDEGKRKTLVLATITKKLGGIRSEREENTVTMLKCYYHLINCISDLKSEEYWINMMVNSNPHIDLEEIKHFLESMRPNKRMP